MFMLLNISVSCLFQVLVDKKNNIKKLGKYYNRFIVANMNVFMLLFV